MFKIEWHDKERDRWVESDEFDDVDEAIKVARFRSELNDARYRVVSFTIYWES